MDILTRSQLRPLAECALAVTGHASRATELGVSDAMAGVEYMRSGGEHDRPAYREGWNFARWLLSKRLPGWRAGRFPHSFLNDLMTEYRESIR